MTANILRPDFARMKRDLSALVAINTENPPGNELEAARHLHKLLEAEGFDLTLSEYKPARANVIAIYENGRGPTFAFNTHIDTVPAGEGWTSSPFELREADGKLYGRGSCDAKGPMAAMIEACRMLIDQKAQWSGTLMAVFTADEEVASEGAKHYVAQKPPKIDFAVIGEPTSNCAYTAHKGSLRPLVRVYGVAAHSGTPHLGENAIYRAGQFLGLIEDHHEKVVKCRCHDLVGTASLTVTRIQGGHADNVVPGACDLLLDRRMVPGEAEDAVKAEINQLLAIAKEKFGVRAEVLEYKATTGGATETALSEPIVQASLAACREHNHGNAGPFGFQGGCDLVHFRSLGTTGTVIGPGSLAVAHKPDEFVPIDEFIASALIYRDVALRMLRKL